MPSRLKLNNKIINNANRYTCIYLNELNDDDVRNGKEIVILNYNSRLSGSHLIFTLEI
jgi:hypothetical protein